MKKRNIISKQNTLLLTSASSLVLLAGCDFTEMKNPFATERPSQAVEGQRRQPIYNQQMLQRMQEQVGSPIYGNKSRVPSPPPEMQSPPVVERPVAPPVQETFTPEPAPEPVKLKPAEPAPRAVAVPAPAPRPVAEAPMAPPPGPDAFTTARAKPAARVMETPRVIEVPAEPQQMAAPAPVASPAPAEEGNVFTRFFSDDAPSDFKNPPPWKMREGVQEDYVAPATQASAPGQNMLSSEQASAPSEPAAQPQGDESAPAWANQWIGIQPPQPDASMENERKADYPAFNSVPERPADMEAAKANAKQSLDELQNAQKAANQERSTLSAEPSQQFKSTPVEMAPPPPAESYVTPAQSFETQPQPQPQMAAPESPRQAQEPASAGSPRRGVDIMTQEQWEALKRANGQPAPEQAPAEPRPTSPYDQHGALEMPASVLPHMLLSGVAMLENAEENAAATDSISSFFARVFGSFKDNTETNTPGAIASDVKALPAPSKLFTTPVVVGQNPAAAQQLEAKAEQLWLLPPETPQPPRAVQKAAEEASEDWLLALVSQSSDSENKQLALAVSQAHENSAVADQRLAEFEKTDAGLSPEKQLLAQMGAGLGITTDNNTPAQNVAEQRVAQQFAKIAPPPAPISAEVPAAEVQTSANAPAAPALSDIQFAKVTPGNPIPVTTPKTEPAVQPEIVADATPVEQPGWLNQLFSQKLEPPKLAGDRKMIFGTQLATSASASEPATPETTQQAEKIATPVPAEQPQTTAQAEPEPAPLFNRAIIEHNARMAAKNEAKLASKSKNKAQRTTTLAKKSKPQAAPTVATLQAAPEQPAPASMPIQANLEDLPVPVIPSPVVADNAVPAAAQTAATPETIWQKAEEEKKETITNLPTAPEHMQSMLAPAQPQPTPPQWYNTMLNGKDTAAENMQALPQDVNTYPASAIPANTAVNPASPAALPVGEVVNTIASSAEEKSNLPELNTSSAPVTSAIAADAGALAAKAASSLPSPKILQEIKMMPASGLSTRVHPGTLQ